MKKGFTLIELLVAISIIGILATLLSANLNQVRGRARDTIRKSDLKQYSTALESFGNTNNGLYPSYTVTSQAASDTGLCDDLGLPSCPDDPMIPADSSYMFYKYISDGTGSGASDATNYILWADLESGDADYWVLCSNGQVGLMATQPTSSTCPL